MVTEEERKEELERENFIKEHCQTLKDTMNDLVVDIVSYPNMSIKDVEIRHAELAYPQRLTHMQYLKEDELWQEKHKIYKKYTLEQCKEVLRAIKKYPSEFKNYRGAI